MIPTAAPTINCIGVALKNLALEALNDTTVLQQLTATNLWLTALATLLTAASKKLADTLIQNKGGALPAATPTMGRGRLKNKPVPGQLLLDPQSSGQPKPPECNLRKQGCGT